MLLLYISYKKNFFIKVFFIKDYIQEIENVIVKYYRKKYVAHQFPQINHYLSLLDTVILLHTFTFMNNVSAQINARMNLLANTLTPDIAQYHLEQNLTASCLCCWSSGLTKREIPTQYYTSTEMYADKCMESQVCNDCTYRWNSVSEVLSGDVRLSIYFSVLCCIQMYFGIV